MVEAADGDGTVTDATRQGGDGAAGTGLCFLFWFKKLIASFSVVHEHCVMGHWGH